MITAMISQNDFQRQWQVVECAVLEAVRRTGRSGWYVLGEEVAGFESALAGAWGLQHAVGVGNGMDALEIGLRCLNLKPGEKVLTTPFSAFATTLAIIRAGGVPVFVDVDEMGLLDLAECRDLLQKDRSIRFFVPVHLYGFPLDMRELGKLKEEFSLEVVEDCAQAIGASAGGIRVGTVGQVAATSFYPTKNLGAMGDGGALLTNDAEIATRAKGLRNYGQSAHYVHSELGLNSRLDELHAAILRDAFLPHQEERGKARSHTAQAYLDRIKHPLIKLPAPAADAIPAWHLFPAKIAQGRRDELREYLLTQDIMTGVHYPRIIPDQPAFLSYRRGEIAVDPVKARRLATSELSLPIHPFLTEQEVNAVIQACNQWEP
jgi:dTDP-3-amino-3,4,6-trideoxy-alpha-D-glucose transaminase